MLVTRVLISRLITLSLQVKILVHAVDAVDPLVINLTGDHLTH